MNAFPPSVSMMSPELQALQNEQRRLRLAAEPEILVGSSSYPRETPGRPELVELFLGVPTYRRLDR